ELEMPRLFEAFIAEWLRVNAPPNTLVRRQHHAQLDANFKLKVYVDILLCDKSSGHPVAVLDTKYKMGERPSDEDIYQISFYARELEVKRAILIYPTLLANPFRMLHGRDIHVESLAFDLAGSLPVAGGAFLEALTACLPAA